MTVLEARVVFEEAAERYFRLAAENLPLAHAKRTALKAWSVYVKAKNTETRDDQRIHRDMVA